MFQINVTLFDGVNKFHNANNKSYYYPFVRVGCPAPNWIRRLAILLCKNILIEKHIIMKSLSYILHFTTAHLIKSLN